MSLIGIDCPFCVRENGEYIKKYGYGTTNIIYSIIGCNKHKELNKSNLGHNGWFSEGNSVQNFVLNGWGNNTENLNQNVNSYNAGYSRKYICGFCQAQNRTKKGQDPQSLIQYCMACGRNTFIQFIS
jgi:hypothetical protein